MERQFASNPDYASLSESVSIAGAVCGISLWLRTTYSAAGKLFVAVSPGGHATGAAMFVALNLDTTGDMFGGGFAAGSVAFRARADNGHFRKAAFSGAGLFDGGFHHLLWYLDDSVIKAFLDGVEQSVSTVSTIGSVDAFTFSEMGTGDPATGFGEVDADVGEIAIIDRIPTAAEIDELAAGFSPRFMRPPPVRHWSGVRGELRDSVGNVDWYSASPILDHPRIVEPDVGVVAGQADMSSGYELFVRAGSPPDPGVDAPLMRLPKAATGASIAGFSFMPNVPHFVSVWPRNINGLAVSAPVASFPVDSGGIPQLAPEAVTGLRATPLRDGNVRIEWKYAESNPLTVAAQFEITLTPIGISGQTPLIETVPHTLSQPSYAVELGPLVSGLWKCEVRSVAASGAQVRAVQGVHVRADAAPPAEVVVGLEAA